MRRLILLGACALALAACTTAQKERVEVTASALCQSVPLVQTLYNTALANHDNATANLVLTTIQISCPAVLSLIHTYQPPEPVVVPVPAPTATGERG